MRQSDSQAAWSFRRSESRKVRGSERKPGIQIERLIQSVRESEKEEESGGLWDATSRHSKSSKVILEDGALVPKEAFKRTSVAKSIKNMTRGRSLVQNKVLVDEKKKPAKAAFEASADEYVRNQPFFSFFVGCLVALSSSFAQ